MIVIPLADALSPRNLKKIRAALKDDGVIAYPTDTLYGLGGNFFSLAVMDRLDAMKGRGGQPYSAAVGDMAMLASLVAGIPSVFRDRLQRLLPGKFTFLFKPRQGLDPRLLRGSDKIGVRMPALPGLLQMLQRLGLPLFSTSANRSGQPPLHDPRQIAREFPGLDLLIDGGVLPPSLGSTVVDLTTEPPAVLRAGDDAEKFKDILRNDLFRKVT